MRDITAGHDVIVQGDVIDNSSSQPKLLSVCTNEELVDELAHRNQLLQSERRSKWNGLAFMWLFIVLMFGAVALVLLVQGWDGLSDFVLAFGGLLGILASLKFMDQPTEFEARQLAALQEIKMLLRERGITR